MDVRETINQHPRAAATVVAVFLVALLGWKLVGGQQATGPRFADKGYFSDDDGKTFFDDDATKIAPFDRGGRQVVAAHVFECADGKRFVGYLERASSPEAKTFVEKARREMISRAATKPTMGLDSELMERVTTRLEVKRPGEKNWVGASTPEAGAVYRVVCPDGAPHVPREVLP